MTKKQPLKLRRKSIIESAILLSKIHGYNKVTRDQIADHAGVATGTINSHFGTMLKLRRDIMRAAIAGQVLEIIAQGLSHNDPHAKKAPPGLKRKAIESLIGE